METVIVKIGELELTWEAVGIILAAIFSILSFAGNIIQFIFRKKELKKNRNVQYVTDKRVEWMYAVREEASSFLALLYTYKSSPELPENAFEEICKKMFILELYFNFEGVVDNVLVNLMCRLIEDVKENKEIDTDVRLFCNHLRIYLKVEWNRVKFEVDGKEYTKERNKEELKKAYQSFENNPNVTGIKIEEVKKWLEQV